VTARRSRLGAAGRLAVALLVAAGSPACGHRSRPVQLGLKRFSLDIAFKDQSKAVPAPSIPQIVAVQQPVAGVTQVRWRPRPVPRRLRGPCPTSR